MVYRQGWCGFFAPGENDSMIKAEHLSMVYGKDKKAVDDLSFEIAPGEIVGFAGPNGAGKTTVIKMLTGILKPTEGRAFIHGFDIVKEGIPAKRQIAYVADDPDFLLQLTGRSMSTSSRIFMMCLWKCGKRGYRR